MTTGDKALTTCGSMVQGGTNGVVCLCCKLSGHRKHQSDPHFFATALANANRSGRNSYNAPVIRLRSTLRLRPGLSDWMVCVSCFHIIFSADPSLPLAPRSRQTTKYKARYQSPWLHWVP